MNTRQRRPRIPEFRFRVLIIGRANAGKTSILQRVCETTESPIIYRQNGVGKERVRAPTLSFPSLISPPTRLHLTRRWMLVPIVLLFGTSKHGASEASTASTMNLCSPIIWVTLFTILAESNRVAQRNLKFCKNSFDASAEKGDCETDCMQYGLHPPVLAITNN
jgi:hypothetical protein